MNHREKVFIIFVQILIAALVAIDVLDDLRGGAADWHLVVEVFVGLLALAGVFYLLIGTYKLRRELQVAVEQSESSRKSAEVWRAESRKFVDGLARAIDEQLDRWHLSPAEKEVAFLLLKGLSLKEIAEVRKTSERTVRVQAIAIYSKSGVPGRSSLSAYFLEDLLAPASSSSSSSTDALVAPAARAVSATPAPEL